MREIVKGSTSISQEIVLRDSTTGLGKTGLIFSDITGSYTRNRAARTAITMATLASASAAWSSGGFVEIDATNCPGLYRFDVPDAAFATGVRTVTISAKATGAITEHLQFILTGWDPQDAVHGGLSALPNAAAAATGGLACLVAFGGTATAGAASTVTLPSPASTVADFYKGLEVSVVGGTGIGQSRIITTYSVGRVATVDRAWATNPDATSVVEVRDIAGPPMDASLQIAVGTVGTGAIVAGSYAVDAITSGAISNGAAAEIAGQVWEEARSGHTTAGSFGQGVASVQGNVTGSVGSVVSFGTLVADVATAVWAAATRTLTAISDSSGITTLLSRLTAGRATNLDNLDAAVTSRLAPTVAARTLDVSATGEAGIDWANIGAPTTTVALTGTTVGTVTTYTGNTPQTGDNFARLGAPAGASISADIAAKATAASVAALNNVSAAQVKTQVVDALNTDTYAEPSAVPAATATLAAKIGFLMALARNKVTQTATTQLLRNSGDTATIATSTDSDDGTVYTRGGFV